MIQKCSFLNNSLAIYLKISATLQLTSYVCYLIFFSLCLLLGHRRPIVSDMKYLLNSVSDIVMLQPLF